MQVGRRGGAKRGDHPTFVAAGMEQHAISAETLSVSIRPEPPDALRTDTALAGHIADSPSVSVPIDPVVPDMSPLPLTADIKVSAAAARAKAAYDARPKVVFRGVDQEVNDKLRAIYKHQLHQRGGVEGWSEWGRTVLEGYIGDYERVHGAVPVELMGPLRAGRRPGS